MNGIRQHRAAVAAEQNDARFARIEEKLEAILKAVGGKVEAKQSKKADKQDDQKAE